MFSFSRVVFWYYKTYLTAYIYNYFDYTDPSFRLAFGLDRLHWKSHNIQKYKSNLPPKNAWSQVKEYWSWMLSGFLP